jgi:prophage maintenance system killer protein
MVLDLTADRHPSKLVRSRNAIQEVIDDVKGSESKGLTYQAAQLMLALAKLHAFAGANHRTAYSVTKVFLRRNGKQLRGGTLKNAYPFIKNLGNKSIYEVQRWIEHGEE